jgi:hypothetical protein
MVVPAGTGFEYSRTWNNWRDEPVCYGLTSEDEMCNLAIGRSSDSTSDSASQG